VEIITQKFHIHKSFAKSSQNIYVRYGKIKKLRQKFLMKKFHNFFLYLI